MNQPSGPQSSSTAVARIYEIELDQIRVAPLERLVDRVLARAQFYGPLTGCAPAGGEEQQ